MCNDAPTYFNLFEKYTQSHKLSYSFDLLRALTSLDGKDEYRYIEEKYSGPIIDLLTTNSLDEKQFNKLVELSNSEEFKSLTPIKQKTVTEVIKDLKKSGVNLPKEQKEKLSQISQEIATLRQQFEKNIVDYNATLGFVINENEIDGLTPRIIASAKSLAKEKQIDELWIDYNSGLYDDVINSSKHEHIRKRIYEEITLSGLHPEFNNKELIQQIHNKIQEKAHILGYKNHSDFVLEESMAKNAQNVSNFLTKLGEAALPKAQEEQQELKKYGTARLTKIPEFWDRSYIVNQFEKELYDIDKEEIRKYFPVEYVVKKTFEFLGDTFDIQFKETNKKSWHKDVKNFEILDHKGNLLGSFYLDLYMRDGKMSGAWLHPILSRQKNNNGEIIKPVSFLVCNAPQDPSGKSTFSLDDTVTFFHEIGHLLHHTLTQVNSEFFSGINKVQHDAVEFPSQLLENFVYNPNVLKTITQHTQTGEPINDELIERILNHKQFLGASTVVRFVQYSDMDLTLYSQKEKHPLTIEAEMKEKWKYQDEYDNNLFRMPHFQHIFGGGYEAGYYAYQWAEVMSLDCLNLFMNSFDNKEEFKEVAQRYKTYVLETGGINDMNENYKNLTGRAEPDIQHLLNHYGVKKSPKPKP